MKKNKTMRLATLLLALTLITSCFVGGTFAKYITSTNSEDSARVAKWGFNSTSMDITGLFDKAYNGDGDTSVSAEADVIAPGTTGSATFKFEYGEGTANAPEVAYSFAVSTNGSQIDDSIKNNTNILWKLDNGTWGTWDELLNSIKNLSGSTDNSGTCNYAPGTLPTAFGKDDTTHTITWKWAFDENDWFEQISTGSGTCGSDKDSDDTEMGNATSLANVTLKITITATQLDTYTAGN